MIPLAVALGALAYLATFPRTLDPSDESILLVAATRLTRGEVLYREVFEIIGPLSPDLYAAGFMLAGTNIVAAKGMAIAVIAGVAGLLHAWARRVAPPFASLVASVLFLTGEATVWLQASPHWGSTLLALATAVVLVPRGPSPAGRVRTVAAGALLGLAASNHPHRAFFLGVWVVAALGFDAVWGPADHRARFFARRLFLCAAGALAALSVVIGHAAWRASAREVWAALVEFPLAHYGPHHVGMVRWGGALPFSGPPGGWRWLPAAIPILLAIEASWLVRDAMRSGDAAARREQAVRAQVVTLAGLAAASVFYFPDFIHLAFVSPFALAVGAGLVHRVHDWARRRGWRSVETTLGAALGVLLVVGVSFGVRFLSAARAAAPLEIASGFGPVAGSEATQRIVEDLQAAVPAVAGRRARVFSYPADAWTYLVLAADNATPFSFMGQGYTTADQWRQIHTALRSVPPDLVVLNPLLVPRNDPMRSFLVENFGELRRLPSGYFVIDPAARR